MSRSRPRNVDRFFATGFTLGLLAGLAPAPAAALSISTVAVGNPGNANDQDYGIGQFGAVPYPYRSAETEVTNSQYAEFLNAKAASDPLGLYNPSMGSDARAGITRSGVSGSFSYSVKTNMGDKPVNYVSWYDAIRFANWLHNGQGAGSTESGAYTILGGTATPSNGTSITRNPDAMWFLPSANEWYKAAYYDPRGAAQGGPPGDDNYWLYPTSSDAAPTLATANSTGDISNPGPNVANYFFGAVWNGQNGNVTTVGSAGASSTSFYGTSDQGGNVREWLEQSVLSGNLRGNRGGAYNPTAFSLSAASSASNGPTFESNIQGFRVATIPEPSTGLLLALGLIGLGSLRRRRVPDTATNA